MNESPHVDLFYLVEDLRRTLNQLLVLRKAYRSRHKSELREQVIQQIQQVQHEIQVYEKQIKKLGEQHGRKSINT